MKILVLLPRFPHPLDKGDKLRAYHQVVELSKRHQIHLFALSHRAVTEEERDRLRRHCREVEVAELSWGSTAAGILRAIVTGLPLQVGYFQSRRAAESFRRMLERCRPDRVFCQSVRTTEYARFASPSDVTLDLMDAFSWGMRQRAEYQAGLLTPLYRLEARRLQAYEAAQVQRFPRCTMISPVDRQQIDHPDRDRIRIVGNGVDLESFQPSDAAPDTDLLFVGNMAYPPNVWAATHLVREVIPLVRRDHPEVSTLIAGVTPTRAVRRLRSPGVTVTGWVEDMTTIYRRSRIFVAPMIVGTGTPNKLLQALAAGIPAVATGAALRSIGATEDEILVGETPTELAAHVSALLSDPERARRLGLRGREFARSHLDWSEIGVRLEDVVCGNGHPG